MKITIAIIAALAAAGGLWASADADTASEILALERRALDGWQKGDPDPLLAMLDPDITYIHTVAGQRLNGAAAVKALFEAYRGRPLFDSYEIVEPRVQVAGDTAVLTYLLVQRVGGAANRWYGTQVYQRRKEGWRVIHTHWSAAAAAQPQGE